MGNNPKHEKIGLIDILRLEFYPLKNGELEDLAKVIMAEWKFNLLEGFLCNFRRKQAMLCLAVGTRTF